LDCAHNQSCAIGDIIGFENVDSIEHSDLSFSSGEVIFKQGTIAPQIYYVKKGMVRLYLEHRDRKQVLCIEKNGFIGLESIYNDKYYQYSVSAVGDVKVCMIELEGFKRVLESNAKLGSKVVMYINNRLKKLYERVITLTKKQAPARVADVILCFHERLFEKTKFVIPFPRKAIADIANISVESLSRVLKDFDDEDILRSKGRSFEILDLSKLEDLSNYG
jgi:CRP/FNR family transcriptional regulator